MTLTRGIMLLVILVVVVVGLDFAGVIDLGISSGETKLPNVEMPDMPEADLYSQGKSAMLKFNYQEAVDLYRRALEESPDSSKAVDAYYGIAVSLEELDQNKEALAAYKEYVAKFPKDGRVMMANRRIALLGG